MLRIVPAAWNLLGASDHLFYAGSLLLERPARTVPGLEGCRLVGGGAGCESRFWRRKMAELVEAELAFPVASPFLELF